MMNALIRSLDDIELAARDAEPAPVLNASPSSCRLHLPVIGPATGVVIFFLRRRSSPSHRSGKPSFPPRYTSGYTFWKVRPSRRCCSRGAHARFGYGDIIADVLGLAVGQPGAAALDTDIGGHENRMRPIEVLTPLGHLLGGSSGTQNRNRPTQGAFQCADGDGSPFRLIVESLIPFYRDHDPGR